MKVVVFESEAKKFSICPNNWFLRIGNCLHLYPMLVHLLQVCCLCYFVCHCMKSVRIRNFSGPYFPAYLASLRIQSKYGKMWTRKTPNTDTFHAVCVLRFLLFFPVFLGRWWSQVIGVIVPYHLQVYIPATLDFSNIKKLSQKCTNNQAIRCILKYVDEYSNVYFPSNLWWY